MSIAPDSVRARVVPSREGPAWTAIGGPSGRGGAATLQTPRSALPSSCGLAWLDVKSTFFFPSRIRGSWTSRSRGPILSGCIPHLLGLLVAGLFWTRAPSTERVRSAVHSPDSHVSSPGFLRTILRQTPYICRLCSIVRRRCAEAFLENWARTSDSDSGGDSHRSVGTAVGSRTALSSLPRIFSINRGSFLTSKACSSDRTKPQDSAGDGTSAIVSLTSEFLPP